MSDKTMGMVLELAGILEPTWPAMQRELRASGVPLNEAPAGGPPAAAPPAAPAAPAAPGAYDQAMGQQQQAPAEPEWVGRLTANQQQILEQLSGGTEGEGEEVEGEYTDPAELEALFAALGEDDGTDTEGDGDDDFDMEQAARDFHSLMRELVQTEIAPMQAERQAERLNAEAEALEAELPELADPQVAERVLDEAQRVADELARQQGNPQLRELAVSPAFNRQVFLAMKAQDAAEREVPAGSRPGVPLEVGGGVAPTQQADAESAAADAIVGVSKNRTRF